MNENIKELTKQYLDLLEKVKPFSDPDALSEESVALYLTIADVRDHLISVLPYSFKVVKLMSGRYVLKQTGVEAYLRLTDIKDPQTVAIKKASVYRSISKATKFETREDAEDEIGAANFAMFQCYINDAKNGMV
jgi:hypothetical protein